VRSGWSGRISNLNTPKGSGGWKLASHVLTGTAGSIIKIRIAFGSDPIIVADGFAFDNVAITPGTALPPVSCPILGAPPKTNPPIFTWQPDLIANPLNPPTGYTLYFGTSNPPTTVVYNGSATSFASFNIVTPGVTYYYQVISYNLQTISSGCAIGSFVNNDPIFTIPYSENFDNGAGFWSAGGIASSWALGTPSGKAVINSPFSSPNSWVTGLHANYNASENSFVISPFINLIGITTDPILSMQVWWDSEEIWDGALVQVLNTSGTVWRTIGVAFEPSNWYNWNSIVGLLFADPVRSGWSGRISHLTTPKGSGGWKLASHVLTGTAGSVIKIRIAFGSDPAIVADGFAFDNVAITPGVPGSTQPKQQTSMTQPNQQTQNPIIGPGQVITGFGFVALIAIVFALTM